MHMLELYFVGRGHLKRILNARRLRYIRLMQIRRYWQQSNVNTPDFRAFATKLSEEAMEEIRFESITFFREVCRITNLQPKIDVAKACGVLSALLSTVVTKQTIASMCDYFEIFDFMVDSLIAEIFE